MDDTNRTVITASLVATDQRLTFLPSYFGPRLMMRGEALVYAWMRRLSDNYTGGFWNYYTLSNKGFYMAPKLDERLKINVEGNGFSREVSADAAGIIVNLFVLSQLAAEVEGTAEADALIDRFYFLREFVYSHSESTLIFKAID